MEILKVLKGDPVDIVFQLLQRTDAGVIDTANPVTVDESDVSVVLQRIGALTGTEYTTSHADFSLASTTFTFTVNKVGGVELTAGQWLYEIRVNGSTETDPHCVHTGIIDVIETI